jgi:hypothetical protein
MLKDIDVKNMAESHRGCFHNIYLQAAIQQSLLKK